MFKRLVASSLLLIAASARAEIPFAHLGGRVVSEGRGVAGAAVVVRSDSLLAPRTAVTRTSGRYWIPALPAGDYEVTFSHPGLQTVTRHARLRAGEQGRVDVTLLPSAEGESVTLTAATRALFERPEMTWSLHRDVFDLLPFARHAGAIADLAPDVTSRLTNVDGLPGVPLDRFLIPEALAEAIDGGELRGVLTHPAAERFFASLRTTWSRPDDRLHGETVAGGPLGSRLSLLAAAAATDDIRAGYAKTSVALGTSHALTGSWFSRAGGRRFAVDHVGVVGERLTFTASHSAADVRRSTVRSYIFAPAHEIAFGAEREEGRDSFTIDDRWLPSTHWIVTAGATLAGDAMRPRLAVIRDLGHARHRLAGSWRESAAGDEWMLAYGRQLTSNGYARVAALREGDRDRIVVDAMHDYLFLTFGGNASIGEGHRAANGWVIIIPPLIDRRIALAFVERYRNDHVATDIAISAGLTLGRFHPFVKGEVENAFDAPRVWRLGIGVRTE